MAAKIELKKLIGIQVNGKKVVADGTSSPGPKETLFKKGIDDLGNSGEIVFAGYDYKGTFKADEEFAITKSPGGNPNKLHKGVLELRLERPDNIFTIKDVKIDMAGNHAFTGTGKDDMATIILSHNNLDKISITEDDSSWSTTGLRLNDITPAVGSSLKFGEWNDFDLPDKCHVNIDFA